MRIYRFARDPWSLVGDNKMGATTQSRTSEDNLEITMTAVLVLGK